uniref:Phenoloxidase-activating factor 2 n=1 Tax=Diabrotica virgifera virgifera TaxID=50390 RepID=A0A6P7GR36_DIAVI
MVCVLKLSLIVLLTFLQKVVNSSFDEQENQHCVCVPYWQCKEDYSGLVEDGGEVMDVRKEREASNDYEVPCTNDFDVCCPVECGNRKLSSNDILTARQFEEEVFGFRILGENNEAEFAEFPWMLGILEGKTYRCGASLIHPQVAVTAAHCVSNEGVYKIRAGEWNWESSSEPLPHQDQHAKKIIIHPQFHPASLRNDIAIIILKSPFKLSENIGLICLPFRGARLDSKSCVVSGWGKNSHKKGTYQSTLKKMDLPLVPRNRCVKTLQDKKLGPFFSLHQSFICAGGESGKDTCKGDGGSPLMCPIKGKPGKYQQVGIVSWGLTCGLQNTPGVYVNVMMFVDWIDTVLKSHGFDTTVYKYR